MIRLSIGDFGIHENVDDLKNHLIIIENKKYLYNFLNDMYSGCIVKEYVKVFDESYRQLKNLDYIDFIPSLVHIDINNKKNINALIRYLKKSCHDEIEEYSNKINNIIEEAFSKIKLESSTSPQYKKLDEVSRYKILIVLPHIFLHTHGLLE